MASSCTTKVWIIPTFPFYEDLCWRLCWSSLKPSSLKWNKAFQQIELKIWNNKTAKQAILSTAAEITAAFSMARKLWPKCSTFIKCLLISLFVTFFMAYFRGEVQLCFRILPNLYMYRTPSSGLIKLEKILICKYESGKCKACKKCFFYTLHSLR